jgi:UDP-N-acetylglucosamine pyrophosphorylase
MDRFDEFAAKMRAAGMGEVAIETFRRHHAGLLRNDSGLIGEAAIGPVADLEVFAGGGGLAAGDADLLGRTVVLKLNGGLGTSMGLRAAKSLLPVRDGLTFVDLIVRQVGCLREASGARVRLLLMNSFATSADTRAWLAAHAAGDFADPAQFELMQNQVPKIDAATLRPAAWPAEPELEWCPPGHGDLYPALLGSGWLDRLLADGVKYAFVSNSDNLGALLDPVILRHFAESGAPFLMECTRRTAADRKGGHLARRMSDGRLLLREIAQTPEEDLDAFQDIDRHRYFNTNSLWLRLDLLKTQLAADHGVLPLPMIRNNKTVDPRDKTSTPVIQLESAMGAAIECFEGSTAIEVPRSRFAPVKTTGDLLALRSDAYEVLGNGQVRLHASRQGKPPVISLSDDYKLVDALAGLGVPSLIGCRSLKITGPVHFAPGVVIEGDSGFHNPGPETRTVAAGTYRDQMVEW